MGKRLNRKGRKPDKGGTPKEILRMLFVCIAIGIAAGILLARYLFNVYGDLDGGAMLVLYSGLAMCLVSIFLNVIIHEAGHLIFGLLTGYSFLSFRIFSLTFVKEQGRLRCRKFSAPGTSGQCLMIPPAKTVKPLPYRLYNYGGVIMNFLISLLAILPMVLFPGIPFAVDFLLGGFAAGGIMIGAMNGLPLKAFGIANDGYNVRSMKRDATARSSFRRQLELVAEQSVGIRLKDMPEEWFQLPAEADLTNVMNAYIRYMAFVRELDRLDFTAAQSCLEQLVPALPRLPLSYRNVTNLGFLFLTVLKGASGEEIERYNTKQSKLLIKSAKNEINIRRIAYAYYKLYKTDEKAAELCRRRLEILAEKHPVPAEAKMNLMLADYVDQIVRLRPEA